MIKVTVPKLEIETPDKAFWKKEGVKLAKDIRTQTGKGKDYQGQRFKPYSKAYEEKRASKGRTRWVNLTDTGRMLGALARSVFATSKGARLTISGSEGAKAWGLEENKKSRTFFALSDKRRDVILGAFDKWVTKKNGLK